MIIDAHTRIWRQAEQLGRVAEALRRRLPEPWTRPDATTDAHDVAMEAVDAAIILGFESQLLEAHIGIDDVAARVAQQPRRYVGFAGIDPTAGRAVQRLEQALEAGLVGVTVSPAAQGCHPTDTRAMALYEACEARGVPVFFDAGIALAREAMFEFAQPYLLDEVARTFPNLRIVISSFGHPWVEQGLTLLRKHPTVYAGLADLILSQWQLYTALLQAYQQQVIDQIIFGSNFPFCTPERAIRTIYSINSIVQGTQLPSIPREQLRSIVERNTFECLGLSDLQARLDAAEPRSNAAADGPNENENENDDAPVEASASASQN